MRFFGILSIFLFTLVSRAAIPAGNLWAELKAKRDALPGLHQEFDVTQTYKTTSRSQSMKRQIILDMAGGRWRERSVAGSGNRIRIFDGKDLFFLEEDGNEFVRTNRRSKDEDPAPAPYHAGEPDWSKAVELERRRCAIPGVEHSCVILEAPLKRSMRPSSGANLTRALEGSERALLDVDTGALLSVRMAQFIDNQRGGYQLELSYTATRMSYGAPPDAKLFQLPADLREVKQLSPWNAAKIKKRLAGKPAPELALTDTEGQPLLLSAYKGKTVLLDFWTTWCPPCRADAPSLDKLYRNYGGKELMIAGISVNEDRAVVEKYLKEHPHSFPWR